MKKYLCWLFGVLFVSAGINHFVSPQFYMNVMPPYIPWHFELVILSGIIEVVLGMGFLYSKTRKVSAYGIIALLIAVLPAHIFMIQKPEILPNVPVWFLYARFPIQIFIGVCGWFLSRNIEIEEN